MMVGISQRLLQACYVFGAGPPPAHPPDIAEGDLVIAADGGYLFTKKARLRTDVIIGDFDSLSGAPDHEEDAPVVVRLPKEKDQTDTFAALCYGLEQGFKVFYIYGGMGGRIDHTLANIQCLAFLLDQGARGYLHDDETVMTAVCSQLQFAPRGTGIVSVFALGGPAQGVCLHGLKYELENVMLTPDFPLGVSNEFIGQPAHISVERGKLLVIYPAGAQELN